MTGRADLRLAQLVCSRLCHDLAGIAGAIANGIELASESAPGADGEALALVGRSAQQVNARIAFFRAAFGANPPEQDLAGVVGLVDGYLAGGPVRVEPIAGPAVSLRLAPEGVRLTLVLAMVAAGCLPRGGSIRVQAAELAEGVGVSVTAVGKGAAVKPEVAAALAGSLELERASPRDIHALWAQFLAGAAGRGNVELALVDGQIRLGAVLARA